MPVSTTSTISIRGATFERDHRLALTVDDLDIEPGLTAVVGPNGSGKSTLLHALAGLLSPTAGSVSVLGAAPGESRFRVAYVLQAQTTSHHLPVSVREIVELGRAPGRSVFARLTRDDRSAVDSAMERLEVAELANRHLTELSGGQRQRVLIAQGLAQSADVLLLDEPVASVDIASAATVRRAIADECASGKTVLLATHDLGEASRADAAVLLAGRVVAAGNPGEVLSVEHLRTAYAGRILDLGDGDIVLDDGAHHHD